MSGFISNFFDDLSHLPERTMQDSRMARRMKEQADKDPEKWLAMSPAQRTAAAQPQPLLAAYVGAAPGQSAAQKLMGLSAGETVGQKLMGLAPGESLGQKLVGAGPNQTVGQKLMGLNAGQSVAQKLAGAADGQSVAQKLMGASAGQSVASKLIGAEPAQNRGAAAGGQPERSPLQTLFTPVRVLMGLSGSRNGPGSGSDAPPVPQSFDAQPRMQAPVQQDWAPIDDAPNAIQASTAMGPNPAVAHAQALAQASMVGAQLGNQSQPPPLGNGPLDESFARMLAATAQFKPAPTTPTRPGLAQPQFGMANQFTPFTPFGSSPKLAAGF